MAIEVHVLPPEIEKKKGGIWASKEARLTPNKGISFDETFIFNWNTYGLTKHQIMILLKHTLFYAQASKLNGSHDRKHSQEIII